ncbi:MAG: methyltransferase domain-containing protein [Candidatus Diapherotrites archaeon]|uniref:Methyltransferase domain-containing protein n=1 Tax=Candidatus Iainarchaeum sp. TaxID=3101447 RepID=A0A8T5GFQ7_9ARCH|nr:methyltransferase domain-containing protein [Candidatus Diapherotrites archaeon]
MNIEPISPNKSRQITKIRSNLASTKNTKETKDKKPNLTIYYGRDAGLFSLLIEFSKFLYENNKKQTPDIVIPYWTKKTCYWDPEEHNGERNVFDYYFQLKKTEHIEDYFPVLNDHVKSAMELKRDLENNLIKNNDYNIKFINIPEKRFGLSRVNPPDFDFRDFFTIKLHIIKKVEKFVEENFKGKKVMGVHFRGPGHNIEIKRQLINLGYNCDSNSSPEGEITAVPYKEYFRLINRFIRRNPESKLFVTSDDSTILNRIKLRYGDRVIEYPAFRTKGGEMHLLKKQNKLPKVSGFKLGEDVLVEALLLAKCDVLIHQKSNVSNFIKLWNKELIAVDALNPAQYTHKGINPNKNILSKNLINSNKYNLKKVIRYWKNNKHVFVGSSKVGTTIIRNLSLDKLDFPCLFEQKDGLRQFYGENSKKESDAKLEEEVKTKERKVFFIVRSPFLRVISSYEFLKHKMFNECKKRYSAKGINLDNMNIAQYVNFLHKEICDGKSNRIISHFYPQKKTFKRNAFNNTQIDLLWQTEKLEEFLGIWNKAYDLNINIKQRRNVGTVDQNEYYKYYEKYPQLFTLVKKVFKEDLEWLNPIFNYEKDFKKTLKQRNRENNDKRLISTINQNILSKNLINSNKYNLKKVIRHGEYKNLNFKKFYFNKREDVLIGIDTKSNYIIKIELIRNPGKERTIKSEYEVMKHLNNKQCVTCPKVYEYGVISKEELLKIINSRENINRLIKEKYEYIIQEYVPNDGEPRLADIVLAILEQKRLGIFQGDIKIENIRFDSSKSLCHLIDYDQAIYLTDEQSNFSNEKFFEFCSSYYEQKYGKRNWIRLLEKYTKTNLKTLFRSNCFNLGETTLIKNQIITNSETGIYHTIKSEDVFTDGSRKIDIRGKLLDTIKFEKGEKVLDIGCNTGLLCQYLYDRGCNITGIDNDKRVVIAAKIIANILDKKINYYHVDIDQTDEIEDCGTIMLFSVLHHTRNVVKNAQKVANACNRIIIEAKLIEHGAQPHEGSWVRTSAWNFQSWEEFYEYCERIFPGFKFEKNLGLGSKKRNICVFVKRHKGKIIISNKNDIWVQDHKNKDNLFISSSCRMDSIVKPLPYHHIIQHTHNTKEFIQYLNYIENKIDIPHNLEAKVFRSQFLQVNEGKDILQIDKKKLLNEYSNSSSIILEICSQKIYKEGDFYIHHLAADRGDGDNNSEKPSKIASIQSKDELFNDLKIIKEITSNKHLLIVSHINPFNFIKREKFIDQLSMCCDQLNIDFLNLSKIIKKEHVTSPNHLNRLGFSVIKNAALNKLNAQ